VISVNTDSRTRIPMRDWKHVFRRRKRMKDALLLILISSFINSFATEDGCNKLTYCILHVLKASTGD